MTAAYVAISVLGSCYYLYTQEPRGDTIVSTLVASWAALFLYNYIYYMDTIWQGISAATTFLLVHCIATIVTIVIYRISPFHPLASFPGPLVNKITSLRLAYIVASGKRHVTISDLHKKYGTFVRTGPDTISINSLDAVGPIYSSAQCLEKSEAYRPGRFEDSTLFFTRDKQRHNNRRRIWANAFTQSSLRNGAGILSRRTQELVTCIDRRHDTEGCVDLKMCIKHWAYDVMGDLTFGGASRIEFMQEGDPTGMIERGQKAVVVFETFGSAPALFDIISRLPVTDDYGALEILAARCLSERRKEHSGNELDLCSYLLGQHEEKPIKPLKDKELVADTAFAIEAGSDTSAGVLVLIFYHLLSNVDVYNRLTSELDDHFPNKELQPEDHEMLLSLPYLTAVVNEGLRLSTPFPGFPRIVPKEGIVIEGRFIPPGTTVGIPIYAQQTSPLNFWPDPYGFKPERWLEGGLGPGSILRPDALMSFQFGPFSCLGKPLALRQLYLVLSQLLLSYNLAFSAKFDSALFMSGVLNMRTTLIKYPLSVSATPRV